MIKFLKENNYLNILEAQEFVNEKGSFTQLIEELSNILDETYFSRLDNWICYFNQNYSKCICFFSDMVFSLLKAIEENQIIRTQTLHEFNLSLAFFDKIFKIKVSLNSRSIQHTDYLLQLSLLYSKYYGYQYNSFYEVFKQGFFVLDAAYLSNVFKVLFLKYKVPNLLANNFVKLRSYEISALLYMSSGKNIRTFNELPIPISKKESFVLNNLLPDRLNADDNILERAIMLSKLVVKSGVNNIDLLERLLKESKIFKHSYQTFYRDLSFWSSVFVLLSKVDFSNTNLTLTEFVDFFEYKKYNENHLFTLKGRTPRSVTNEITHWHEMADFKENMKYAELNWGADDANQIRKYTDGNVKYAVNEITTGKELLQESTLLKHCVFAYIHNCARGVISIWSLKKEVNTIYEPYITIEVVKSRVVQVAGKYNRAINKIEMQIVKSWAEDMSFKVDVLETSLV